jgi:exportin-2 (importin alpha re-exporter)
MLLTSNSILKRFRYAFKSDALYAELKYALDTLAAPLTRLFGTLGEELRAAAGDAARSAVALESLRLACRVFFSLNWQDLPEFFEDNMAPWMGAFQEFLAYEAPGAAADDEDDDEGPVERLQAAVVENASLYAHKYEEEFQPHLPQFVSGIWQRLMKTSLFPKHDRLAATSMRFLAEVVGQQMHAALFADESTLRQVVEAIVIPNMTLRDSDVELFEDNAVEYISRDLESADSETRRRGARLCRIQIFNSTSICAYATVSTQLLWLGFENLIRAIDSSKNQPNRLRFDRAREFSSLVRTTQTSG